MKDYRIVYIKGEPKIVEWPEKPSYQCPECECKVGDICVEFKKSCEAAIANGVPPADKELAKRICHENESSNHAMSLILLIVEGHPYSLEGYEVKMKTYGVCCSAVPSEGILHYMDCGECATYKERFVAVITPKEK